MNRRIRSLGAVAALAAPIALPLAVACAIDGFCRARLVGRPADGGRPPGPSRATGRTTPTRRSSARSELGDKQTFTAEEAAAFFQSKVDELHAQAADDIHYDDAIWQAENYAKVASLRTSLIVEPRNGRLPALTRARRGTAAAATSDATRGLGRQRREPLAGRALHLVGQRRAADDAADVQRESPDPADQGSRRDPPRDDARRADRSTWTGGRIRRRASNGSRVTRSAVSKARRSSSIRRTSRR